nr:hypothetical protein [Tanacetum cinerariifolium]
MATIEVVNLRVSYQADVRRRESKEFYAWHQDAQDDYAAVRADIEILRRDRLAYEREREYVKMLMIMRLEPSYKMPPKRTATTTTTTPMTDAHLKALIAQGAADALAEYNADRSRNGDDSHDSGTSRRRQAPSTRECT